MKNLFLLAVAALLLAGCSSFNREWNTAIAQSASPADISGPWEGQWTSDKNGHTGRLRGILRHTGNDEYDAHFQATFWKIFRASYRVPLKYNEAHGLYTLSGESDLGMLSGGLYRYEGEATPHRFFSTYENKYDHGTFEMKRPQ
jgi:hypothetical protein